MIIITKFLLSLGHSLRLPHNKSFQTFVQAVPGNIDAFDQPGQMSNYLMVKVVWSPDRFDLLQKILKNSKSGFFVVSGEAFRENQMPRTESQWNKIKNFLSRKLEIFFSVR